ncbi:MAG: SDR family NAD(P)-dependent oxidoreductase [Hyphomicrobiaceae bacterium]
MRVSRLTMAEQRFRHRIALVTGATRGIGRATALALAREGAHVIALGRTVGALEELDDDIKAEGGTATLIRLDLRKGADVDALGPSLYQRWDHLDVVVLNAGVLGPLTPVSHLDEHEWAETIDINLTANWRLMRTLDPLLRRSDGARVVALSSGIVERPRAFWTAYAASKAGLEALMKCYADEVASTPIKVRIVNPGATRTGMRAKAYPGEDPETLPTPDEVAARIVDVVAAEEPPSGAVVQLSPRR